MNRYDATDSPLVHPRDEITVADQIAFENLTDEQQRISRLIVKEEVIDEVYDDLGVQETKDKLTDARREIEQLTDAMNYLRFEGIERIYKNRKGFWLYPKKKGGEIDYNPHESSGPFTTLEDAIEAGSK